MMDNNYRQFFALQSEPFSTDIKRKDIMVTPALSAVQDRVQYAIRLGALALITGEIGSGKSTALRYVIGGFHPSEYRIIYITATSGSTLEIYRHPFRVGNRYEKRFQGGDDPVDQTRNIGDNKQKDEDPPCDRRSVSVATGGLR